MDGRKKSLGQMLVMVAALMVAAGGRGGAARGEAMAKASIDPTEISTASSAAPGAAKATPTTVRPVEHATDDLPPAFQLPVASAARPAKVAAADVTNPPATPKTDDAPSAAQPAEVPTVTAQSAASDTPKISDLEASPIGGSAAPSPAIKSSTASGSPTVTSTGGMSGVGNALQVAMALTVVIGLIFIGKALAKKFVPGAKASNGKGVIEILARYPLCKNQSLVLVRIGSQIVTLNQCKESSQSVLVISDPNEVAKLMGQIEGQSPTSIQAGFSKLLTNARMDLEDPANDPDRNDFELRSMEPENLDNQLEEMASAKRQLMQLRQQVRSVRDSLPRS